jgi:hypothetical protein
MTMRIFNGDHKILYCYALLCETGDRVKLLTPITKTPSHWYKYIQILSCLCRGGIKKFCMWIKQFETIIGFLDIIHRLIFRTTFRTLDIASVLRQTAKRRWA